MEALGYQGALGDVNAAFDAIAEMLERDDVLAIEGHSTAMPYLLALAAASARDTLASLLAADKKRSRQLRAVTA